METNQKNTLLFSILAGVLLLSMGTNVWLATRPRQNTNIYITPTPTPSITEEITPTVTETEEVTPTPTGSVTPTTTPKATTFSNSKLAIALQSGWTASGLSNGSVNITKGAYVLYINPSFIQASGVQGARFDEISSGSPSADLVTVARPASECMAPTQSLSVLYRRYDVYTNNTVNTDICKRTSDSSKHWYFSYYVKEAPYVTYKASGTESYVITVSIKATTLSGLPKDSDATLKARLAEINKMVDSLLIK